jgi:ribose transport system substrate-binding protein
VYLYQTSPQGKSLAKGVEDAAAAVGWSFKSILVNFSDPSTVVAGIKQAINQYHANVVSMSTADPNTVQSVASTVTNAGAILLPQNYPFPAGGPIPVDVAGAPYYTLSGNMVADWVAAKSGGKAHVLYVSVDSFPALKTVREGFSAELTSVCSGCQITKLDIPIAQAFTNQGNPLIASAVRRDSSIDYVVTVDGAVFGGLNTALSAAGVGKKVTIASSFGSVQNQTEVLAGREGATTSQANQIIGWLTIDAALRHFAGMSYPANYGIPPTQLLTSDNKSSWNSADDFQVPADFASVFKTLWKVSS